MNNLKVGGSSPSIASIFPRAISVKSWLFRRTGVFASTPPFTPRVLLVRPGQFFRVVGAQFIFCQKEVVTNDSKFFVRGCNE